MNHWIILPILVPAVVAPLLALAVRHDLALARVFSVGALVLLVILGMFQLGMAADGTIRTYELGAWPAPFGIVLVLDRLSALMLLLTAVLGLFVLLYAISGCDQRGAHFHSLYQFQIMGLNGAFLTGDLFNLFVFFEVLLIASYGLMVHAGGAARTRAGIQYMIINLVGSTIFLIALGLIYGVTGTLNMADFARRIPMIASGDRALLYTGAILLMVVFAIKSALVPWQFWLPGTYANTSGPVAALFSVMTKVGAYAILRVFLMGFGDGVGDQALSLAPWLMPAAVATLLLGMIGVVASGSLGQQASFAALASMGMMLIAIATCTIEGQTAALYYMVHSTLAIAALFLLIDAVVIRRPGYGDALVAAPRFRHDGFIAAMFFAVAVAVLGLPPLSGFVGKLLVLDAVSGTAYWGWLWLAILGGSLLGLIGFAFSGSLVFWKSGEQAEDLIPDVVIPESGQAKISGQVDYSGKPLSAGIALPMVAIVLLLGTVVLWTGFSGVVLRYLDATSHQLFTPQQYVTSVLGTDIESSVPEVEEQP